MKRNCRRVQHTLAEHGPAAFRDDEAAQRHLEECSECFTVLEGLTALDAGFDAMPPVDAPDELVESLLARIAPADAETATHPEKRSWAVAVAAGARKLFAAVGGHQPRLRAGLAFGMLGVISASVFLNSQFQRAAEPFSYREVRGVLTPTEPPTGWYGARAEESEDPQEILDQLGALGYLGGEAKKFEEARELEQAPAGEMAIQFGATDPRTTAARLSSDMAYLRSLQDAPRAGERAPRPPVLDPEPARKGAKDDLVLLGDKAGAEDLPRWISTAENVAFRGGSPRVESAVARPFGADDEERQRIRERLRERLRRPPPATRDADGDPPEEEANVPAGDGEEAPVGSKGGKASSAPSAYFISGIHADAPARELARRFLAERDATAAAGRPATGYWTNTYVPGDPALRYLQARLAGGDRSLLATSGGEPRLHDGARRVAQPFDPPPDAALAVQLHADRATILGETRMLVQVGLAGTARGGGRRGAMNVALVLDLRDDVPAETGAMLVALAGAFAEAQDVGDRFRLFAAGRGSGEVAAPAAAGPDAHEPNLRRGQAVVAVRNLLAAPATGATLALHEALRLAIEDVARGDDPNAPLGSSTVIVATSRPLGRETEMLAAMAHESAVAGIPLSIVGAGRAARLSELDSVALSGQGSRRLLLEAAGARGLIDRELAAAGRAVARAVRLSLDLAPGVRLIDVVGARRLGDVKARWVRESERAIDLHLAHSLGIEADRGDDEAGIQIVIPTFYAADHHVVLLDVVAPGPGPVVDVSVRFKDLVRLENAVVRSRLEVARGEGGRGPLERNVLKNLLAHRLYDVLEDAGWRVTDGDRATAARLLDAHRRMLDGLRLELAGFDRDPDLGRDLAMLEEYVRVLGGSWLETPERRQYLADSLRYAARLKVLPAPVPLGGAE